MDTGVPFRLCCEPEDRGTIPTKFTAPAGTAGRFYFRPVS